MDRRGLRRTKATHINPVPIFVLAIALCVVTFFQTDFDTPWWNLPIGLALTFASAFIIFLAQARYAENSSPIYFGVFLFIIATNSNLYPFEPQFAAIPAWALATAYLIKYVCDEQRKDYIANIVFLCLLAAVFIPSGVFLLPVFCLLIAEESGKKGSDLLTFILSTVISAAVYFGFIYLFKGMDTALEYFRGWSATMLAIPDNISDRIPLLSGFMAGWQSMQFARSLTYALLFAGGIVFAAIYFNRHSRLKSDDASISKVCIYLAVTGLILAWLYSANQIEYEIIAIALMSVPVTHVIAGEGRHILMSIYLSIVFICALCAIIPVFELL